jgi:hypothetical protein
MAQARMLDLGSMTAKQIAEALGVRLPVVYKRFTGKYKSSMPAYDWTLINPESCALYSDKQFSKMIGCHKQMVVRKRIEKGIYRDGPRAETNAGKAVATVGRWCTKRGGTGR